MKNKIKRIQEKIYAIWLKTKQRISSFVGGQFIEIQKRNETKENTHFTKSYIHAKYNIRDGLDD